MLITVKPWKYVNSPKNLIFGRFVRILTMNITDKYEEDSVVIIDLQPLQLNFGRDEYVTFKRCQWLS